MITFFLFYSVEVIGFIWYGFDVLPLLHFGHFTRARIHDSWPLGQGHFPSYSRVR